MYVFFYSNYGVMYNFHIFKYIGMNEIWTVNRTICLFQKTLCLDFVKHLVDDHFADN